MTRQKSSVIGPRWNEFPQAGIDPAAYLPSHAIERLEDWFGHYGRWPRTVKSDLTGSAKIHVHVFLARRIEAQPKDYCATFKVPLDHPRLIRNLEAEFFGHDESDSSKILGEIQRPVFVPLVKLEKPPERMGSRMGEPEIWTAVWSVERLQALDRIEGVATDTPKFRLRVGSVEPDGIGEDRELDLAGPL